MRAKVSLITGANSGIGYATAEKLARLGHHVILVCRNEQRGKEAQQTIIKRTGNRKVDLLLADLSSLRSTAELARKVNERYDRLDVLINNAGGIFGNYKTNDDGFEQTFAVNYLAPFLLSQLLLQRLKNSGGGRIINVASDMQAEQFDPDNAARPDSAAYNRADSYRAAVTAMLMMNYHMAKELHGSGVTVNALHPGVIYTPQSARNAPALFRPLMKLFLQSPQKGARTSIYLATSDEVSGTTGEFFVKGSRKTRSVPITYNPEKQRELHEKSIQWTSAYLKGI